jgi:hypothetical protein
VQQIARHLRSHPLAVRRPTTPPTVRARPGGPRETPTLRAPAYVGALSKGVVGETALGVEQVWDGQLMVES